MKIIKLNSIEGHFFMNAIEYIKEHHSKDSIITKDMVLAKFCTVQNNYKHPSFISCNVNIVNLQLLFYKFYHIYNQESM